MRNLTKPLLAATLTDFRCLRYPVLASPKLDGIRMRVFPRPGGAVGMSRHHIPIPNQHIQKVIAQHPDWLWLDGEIIVGSPTAQDCFNVTQSAAMRDWGEPEFKYYIFDSFEHPEDGYIQRLNRAVRADAHLKIVTQEYIASEADLIAYELQQVNLGYEGIMVRKPDGHYKAGRSTEREGLLWKVKRMQDAEAVIIGAEPLRHNTNPAFRNEQGNTKRSSAKAGKVESPFIGKFRVQTEQWGTFSVGTNGSKLLMADVGRLIGKTITFTYQQAGTKDHPRIPIFKGLRAD